VARCRCDGRQPRRRQLKQVPPLTARAVDSGRRRNRHPHPATASEESCRHCGHDFRLKLPSRPEEFHPEPLTDSVREPPDSYGSCHRVQAAAFPCQDPPPRPQWHCATSTYRFQRTHRSSSRGGTMVRGRCESGLKRHGRAGLSEAERKRKFAGRRAGRGHVCQSRRAPSPAAAGHASVTMTTTVSAAARTVPRQRDQSLRPLISLRASQFGQYALLKKPKLVRQFQKKTIQLNAKEIVALFYKSLILLST